MLCSIYCYIKWPEARVESPCYDDISCVCRLKAKASTIGCRALAAAHTYCKPWFAHIANRFRSHGLFWHAIQNATIFRIMVFRNNFHTSPHLPLPLSAVPVVPVIFWQDLKAGSNPRQPLDTPFVANSLTQTRFVRSVVTCSTGVEKVPYEASTI